MTSHFRLAAVLAVFLSASAATSSGEGQFAATWSAEHRLIDLHQHVDYTTQHLTRAVKIMDAVGLGMGVNLSGGYVTRTNENVASEFERNNVFSSRRRHTRS